MNLFDYIVIMAVMLCYFWLNTANAEQFEVFRNPPPKGFESTHISDVNAEIDLADKKRTRVSVWACGTYIGVVGPSTTYWKDEAEFVRLVDQEIERACDK